MIPSAKSETTASARPCRAIAVTQTNRARRSFTCLPFHLAQQFSDAVRIRGVRTGVARGMNSRRAAERGHHQAGIVREHDFVREPAVVQRLAGGYFRRTWAPIRQTREVREIRKQIDFDRRSRRRAAIFAQFSGVRRGQQNARRACRLGSTVYRGRPRKFMCSSSCCDFGELPDAAGRQIQQFLQFLGSCRGALRRLPALQRIGRSPVITTFISTCARESSS